MLTTPFGKIKVYTDGVCIDYEAAAFDFNSPPCRDKPVFGCYRIVVDARGHQSISCIVEQAELTIRNIGSSGQAYIDAEFIRGGTILTIDMEDENPAFESVRIEDGLRHELPIPVDRVVFGVAWVTDYEGPDDCRTWFAADPTINFQEAQR